MIKLIDKFRGASQLVSRLCELLGHREWGVSTALCVLLFFSLSMAVGVTESICSIDLLLSLRITQHITTLTRRPNVHTIHPISLNSIENYYHIEFRMIVCTLGRRLRDQEDNCPVLNSV